MNSFSFRLLLSASLFSAMLFSNMVLAKTVNSSFDFSVTVPDEWFVLTKQEIENNSELLSNVINGFGLDQGVANNIKLKIQSGQIEFVYLNNSSSSKAANNINFLTNAGNIPEKQQVKTVCQQYAVGLPKLFKKPIEMYECELKKVAGIISFYTEFDGIVDNTRNAQYQFQGPKNQVTILTLTATNDTFLESRKMFVNMVETIRFK